MCDKEKNVDKIMSMDENEKDEWFAKSYIYLYEELQKIKARISRMKEKVRLIKTKNEAFKSNNIK